MTVSVDIEERLRLTLETTDGMREIVQVQTRLIDSCLAKILEHEGSSNGTLQGDTEVLKIIKMMIHIVGISGHSVLKLTDEVALGVRDGFPIARGIIESVVNICLIMAEGRGAAETAMRHAAARSIQNMSNDWHAGGIRITLSRKQDPFSEEELQARQALVDEFTYKNGRPRPWTDLSLRKRLDRIAESFPSHAMISLGTSSANIYGLASEIVHGSYFSVWHFWGVDQNLRGPPGSLDGLKLVLADHQFSVLMSVIFAYAGLFECFAHYTGVGDLRAASDLQLRRLSQLPAVKAAMLDGGTADVKPE